MEKKNLLKRILGKKELPDYTYAILFFLISSFFLIFAIKPALSIAFSLRRQAADLHRIETGYEANLQKLTVIQSNMERMRDRIYLLEQAVPQKPEIDPFFSDIRESAKTHGIIVTDIRISPVKIIDSNSGIRLNQLNLNINSTGNYEAIRNFTHGLLNQRRLKVIKKLEISRNDKFGTSSSQLKVIFNIEGYYL